MFGTRTIALICIAGSAISLLLSVSSGSALFAFLCALLLTLSLILWKYGYAIMPSVFLALGLKEKIGDFQIPPSQDIIVKKTQTGYLSTMFLGVRLEPSPQDQQAQNANFAKAISSVRSPCKFSILVYNPDMSQALDELKTRRSVAENKKSQLLSDQKSQAQVSILDREIAMWTKQIARLAGGEKPVQSLSFVSTSASGESLEESESRVRSQASELRAVLSSALCAELTPLRGEEMKKCFEWEYAIPGTAAGIMEETG